MKYGNWISTSFVFVQYIILFCYPYIQKGILFVQDRKKQTANFLSKLVNLTNQVLVNFTKTNQGYMSVSRVKTRMYCVKYVLNISRALQFTRLMISLI